MIEAVETIDWLMVATFTGHQLARPYHSLAAAHAETHSLLVITKARLGRAEKSA